MCYSLTRSEQLEASITSVQWFQDNSSLNCYLIAHSDDSCNAVVRRLPRETAVLPKCAYM